MYREGLGWIDFEWGDVGEAKPSGNTDGGFGLSHIMEARQRKDKMTKDQAIRFLDSMVDTIAKGNEISRKEVKNNMSVRIEDNVNRVILVKMKGSNSFVISGYEKRQTG